jgi:hypothetical protein
VKVAHFFFLAGSWEVGGLERVVLCRISCWILHFSQSSNLWGTLLFRATCCMCSHSLFCCSWLSGRESILLIWNW